MEKSLIKSISRFRPKLYRKGLCSFSRNDKFPAKNGNRTFSAGNKSKNSLIDFWGKYSCSQRREQLCMILTNRNSCSILSKQYFLHKIKGVIFMKKIIIFALAALLCSFSLAGCSGDSEDGVPGKGVW